ncbi:ABC transporter permease [Paremcibacter congregatus]|uniref:Transport permease protein n=1 Tax=Paremcibacter congregatus TaxID=2043170 RepID=A0A2G4YQ38_9PROT|nr:ABC transporter permease [Paremcibacter congregatus]PHZ83576.1 mannose-1-phosphate guanyltransferase [Paremcibacter congregatus]QDE28337.1 ABC transporter permease [Paremcibacter congregatus]
MVRFSLSRLVAVLLKEFIQMRRDRMTLAMMIALPMMQLIMFGFAINTDPRHLPAALMDRDQSALSRAVVAAVENSTFIDISHRPVTEDEAERLMREGRVNYLMIIPEHFSRDLHRGLRPQMLLVADATDPSAASGALNSINQIVASGLRRDFGGAAVASDPWPVEVVVHRRYNPAGLTHYNIVPGLLGVILAMTMSMMTAVALTRESEQGTMENLLATPVRPLEMMLGKIAPYVIVGYSQTAVILLAGLYIFHIPFVGSLLLLLAVTTLFVVVNLILGFLFSTLARTQMQALQMTFFLLLPQILLSGFMFPFLGMPRWAQVIGEVLPATHYMRLVRGIMLKGAGLGDLTTEIWPLLAILLGAASLALLRYRRTLD